LGRSPWVVYGVMRIEDAVSPTVPSAQILLSLVLFTLVYGALMIADIYLLVKFAKADTAENDETIDDQAPLLVSAEG